MGDFFRGAHHFTATNGTFNSVQGNQTNFNYYIGADGGEEGFTRAIDNLVEALTITKEASRPLPRLQVAVGKLMGVPELLRKSSSNFKDVETLTKYVRQLEAMCREAIPTGTPERCPPSLTRRADTLSENILSVIKNMENMSSRSTFMRVLSTEDSSGEIQQQIRHISWAINDFLVSGSIALELALDEMHVSIDMGFFRMDHRFDQLSQQVNEQMASLGNQIANLAMKDKDGLALRHAIAARFDQPSNRVSCQDKTRLETLAFIYQWLNPDDGRLGSNTNSMTASSAILGPFTTLTTDSCIFWLTGLAGTGKSTIAQSIAEWCYDNSNGFLGASFFCRRDSDECSNVQLIFPTIAYQLCYSIPNFREHVENALRADPHVQTSLLSRQLHKLIVEPLKAVRNSGEFQFSISAIIIDALDECKDDEATSTVLKALNSYVTELYPLKFVITSRPVFSIINGFKMKSLNDHAQKLVLHEIPVELTNRDIRMYLHQQLLSIADSFDLHEWPTEEELEVLISRANGLFIFAATAVKFLMDRRTSNPKAQLIVLHSQVPNSSSSPYRYLDTLYLQVLHSAFPDLESSHVVKLRLVLGTIVLARDPLSPNSLEELLGLEPGTVRPLLLQLHSLLVIPSRDILVSVIRTIHPSFHDFLVDRERCVDKNFFVNPTLLHTVLAQRCLRMLKNLRNNICEIPQHLLNVEVPNLMEQVVKHLPPTLQYACRHWTYHLSRAQVDNETFGLLDDFCSNHLLHWLEVLSILNELGTAVDGLQSAQRCLLNLPLPSSKIQDLLYDCERVTREFFPGINASCLQVYQIFPFCPLNSIFRKTYESQSSANFKLLSGSTETWSLCLQTMEGHSAGVKSVAYSPNGKRIISGAADKTIRIWDVSTGAQIHIINFHKNDVNAVSFSPDGKQFLSASSDKTIAMWDAATGTLLSSASLTGAVQTISFAPSGSTVASGLDNGHISLWNISPSSNAMDISTHWFAHRATINSLKFSRKSDMLVSCADDGKGMLWDSKTKSCLLTFPHEYRIMSIAISYDDTIVACGAAAPIVFLWDAKTGNQLRALKTHTQLIWSVDFTSDDMTLASASWDHTIRVWDATDGTEILILEGHPDQVYCVQFSENKNNIVSSSVDNSIRIWDCSKKNMALKKPCKPTWFDWGSWFKGDQHDISKDFDFKSGQYRGGIKSAHHHSVVRAITFSPCDSLLGTGSWDGTVRLWNVTNGSHLKTLEGHSGDLITSIAFALNNTCFASAGHAQDKTIHLWSLKSFKKMESSVIVLRGHSKGIWMVLFTGDSRGVVSCSDDGSIRFWSIDGTQSEHQSSVLHQCDGPVYSMAISPDTSHTLLAFTSLDLIPGSQGRGYPYLRLLDMQMRTILWESNYNQRASSISFSNDGTRFVTGCEYGPLSVCIWKLSLDKTAKGSLDARVVRTLTFEVDDSISHVVFSTDGRFILSDASFHAIPPNELPVSLHSMPPSDVAVGIYLFKDWIWTAQGEHHRRICWVPPTFRHVRSRQMLYRGNMAVMGSKVALGTEFGRVVIVDFQDVTVEE